jgi:sugar lactone lactonase YvrE
VRPAVAALVVVLALATGCHPAAAGGDALDRAYRNKDYRAMLALARRAAVADPTSPRALYTLACAQALNHRAAATAATIDRLTALSSFMQLAKDADLDGVRKDPAVAAALERLSAVRRRVVGAAEVRFTLDDPTLLVEGLAYDPTSGDFFVSSVHRRRILRIGSDGQPRDFVPPGSNGLYGVVALRVDPARHLLWATSSALPEVEGISADERGHTAVHSFDLATGALVAKVELFEPDQRHHFDDLVLDSDGQVYVSDGFGGAIYVVAPGGSHQVWLPPGVLASPQGLAWSADGRTLFAADYGRGLYAIDRATRAVRRLRSESATLTGLDGLVLDPRDGSLIATQNGVVPARVVRLTVDGDRVRSQILVMNAPGLTEPTLGTIVDGAFVFVANAQWDAFAAATATAAGGAAKHPPRAGPTLVMRLPLE